MKREIYDSKFKKALERYVNDLELNADISNNIRRGIKTYGNKITHTVYRGQTQRELKINCHYWFSTTISHNVAKYFAKDCGIIYIINVIDSEAIIVNEILTVNEIGEHYEEEEIIIDGKKKFYVDESCLVEGFCRINDNLYETWYTTQFDE